MKCRFCKTLLEHSFIDLGFAPPSNSYLTREDLSKPEIYYPLRVKVCDQCWLVQTEDFASKHEFFNDEYAYFSSTSKSWCEHAKKYVHMIVPRLGLSEKSLVIEIASNDGYLLEHFGPLAIPCLGIEPTLSTALEAEKKGIEVIKEFFTVELSKDLVDKYGQADLIIGNNVFAHVPDILDFSIAMKNALKSDGVITLEFPHLLELIKNNQFDTIYHEHYSYLSLLSVTKILAAAKLKIYDVEQVSTHGGSLRIYCTHEDSNKNISLAVRELLKEEIDQGLDKVMTYLAFQKEAEKIKNALLTFLISLKNEAKKVAAYGAAAKGNTLLNYAGIKPDLLPLAFDAAIAKQGKYMPGSHIPILSPDELNAMDLDFLLILPWNIADEVFEQNKHLKQKGTKFVTAIPKLSIF